MTLRRLRRMAVHPPVGRHARALERLWAGALGDEYTQRNLDSGARRWDFWAFILQRCRSHGTGRSPTSALEIGCNVGSNLRHLRQLAVPWCVGVDINALALRECVRLAGTRAERCADGRQAAPAVSVVRGSAYALPFAARSFDLVLSGGSLTGTPSDGLMVALDELARVARHWIALTEYESAVGDERLIPWRGIPNAVFARPYGVLLARRYPGLELLERGGVGKEDGFDDCGYSLWRVPAARLVAAVLPPAP